MEPALLTLLVLGTVVVGYSWLGWRVLATHGVGRLIALAVAATILCSVFLALRPGSRAGWGGADPGQIPGTAIVFGVLLACGFAGASLALWHYRRTQAGGAHPLMLGVLGFVAGLSVPLMLVMALDLVRVLGGAPSQLSN